MSYIRDLAKKGIAHTPKWLVPNLQYEVIMGSFAYGVSSDTSDVDIYAWTIPHKDDVFPALRGEIPGFGTHKNRFEQYQEHHLNDVDALGGRGRIFDVTCYSIVKYFDLVMRNNPNMIDSLFVPDNCISHITKIGTMVRERRHIFLHKGAFHTFKGYSYAQAKS